MPVASLCWVVTMLEENTISRFACGEIFRMFKMPDILVSVNYFVISYFLPPALIA